MYQSTREYVFNLVLELREAKRTRKNTYDLLADDPFTKDLYKNISTNLNIEDYLDGGLTVNESKRFERELKTHPEIARETALRSKVNKAIEDIELIRILEAAHASYLEEQAEAEKILSSSHSNRAIFNATYFARWIAVACVVVFLGLSLDHYFANKTPWRKNLYSEYYSPYRPGNQLLVNRSRIIKAELKYQQGNYYDALVILGNLPDNLNIKAEKEFYSGLSFMETQSFENAINAFSSIVNSKDRLKYFSQAYWYLGLCYLKTSQQDKALETFRHIVKYSGYNYKKAKKIVDALD